MPLASITSSHLQLAHVGKHALARCPLWRSTSLGWFRSVSRVLPCSCTPSVRTQRTLLLQEAFAWPVAQAGYSTASPHAPAEDQLFYSGSGSCCTSGPLYGRPLRASWQSSSPKVAKGIYVERHQ